MSDAGFDWGRARARMDKANLIRSLGKVTKVVGLVIEAVGQEAFIGELCRIRSAGRHDVWAEVVGFHGEILLLMPLGEIHGIRPGSEVVAAGRPFEVPVGRSMLGRVVNGLGRPIDGKAPVEVEARCSVHRQPPSPMTRAPIIEPLATGIRVIDGLLTCGKGQRVGIFAGSGVGKSTLLGMIARYTEADVNVIALVGERGREVREFITKELGEDGLRRSVVVVATSNEPSLLRRQAAYVATAIAEYFRDQGKHVLLMMDSLTRFALAQREIGLSVGEPPTTRGYPPSAFAMLPGLLERAGTADHGGSITGLYTILVEGDDMNEPVADHARAILDGHIVLTRELAERNHYPPVDFLGSVSRLMSVVAPREVRAAASKLRELLAAHRQAQDLINIGAYVSGSNPKVDEALRYMTPIEAFLRQSSDERSDFPGMVERLVTLFAPETDAAAPPRRKKPDPRVEASYLAAASMAGTGVAATQAVA
ncbi:MAG: flagellar protein export ATPase FliI [Candidatus Methylomirabilis oxygeniifera]|uniref:Flagellum-specific ATP synthase n=1 Tax=Methylomirabilis oxygeniifera TaxID=671143 RepID=D5MGD0_METO1|nr:MAG: flagellar protein export ATPase FliI [Candidatus Methylomirabilis oxyfera]CBE68811.1 flagellum-specific ATP synthase [Candidatus Methylomirabilis oxyfera]